MAVIVQAGSGALSKLAIASAVAEARLRDLPVVLVAQVDAQRREASAETYQKRHDDARTRVEAQVDEIRRQGLECTAYLPNAPASAADAVLAAAREHRADLIVVGTRRRSPVGKALFGSTAQDILLGADAPVLAVKLTAEEEAAL